MIDPIPPGKYNVRRQLVRPNTPFKGRTTIVYMITNEGPQEGRLLYHTMPNDSPFASVSRDAELTVDVSIVRDNEGNERNEFDYND